MSNVFCGIRSEYTSVTLLLNVNINLIVLKGGKRHACSSVEEYGLLGCNVYSSEITRRFEGTCRFHLHSLQAKPPALVAFFLLGLLFDPEDGGDMLLQKGQFSPNYMALLPTIHFAVTSVRTSNTTYICAAYTEKLNALQTSLLNDVS